MKKGEDGRFSETRTDREVLDAVADHAPAGTAEVAEALDVTRQAADYRLRRLREDGRVGCKQIGPVLAWSLSAGTVDEPPDTPTAKCDIPTTDTEPRTAVDELEGRIRALDVPGSGTSLDRRVAATVRVVEHLEREGEANTEELKNLLDDEDVGYADVNSYWANFIRGCGVLKQLKEVEAPGKGEKTYRYRTDS